MGWGQILTLKMTLLVKFIGIGKGSNFNIENDSTCISTLRVVMKYKLHWDGLGSNFNVEK